MGLVSYTPDRRINGTIDYSLLISIVLGSKNKEFQTLFFKNIEFVDDAIGDMNYDFGLKNK